MNDTNIFVRAIGRTLGERPYFMNDIRANGRSPLRYQRSPLTFYHKPYVVAY
ncbi:hypothetical protein IQ244_18115 [Nostoc sp. LEGE 06077]|uniref:hypothetical protein n=1 Tax=Nostoc sp. LEGE 06077 TaxID=915325 RepID=UPI001881E435|nr:hypothetical protein [Nostoc sp. LEGE 06077]MBE9208410.1 hypothetical protein [Nostoc sp. LEGE 06077]